jgi:hypothetical protein
VTAGMTDDDGKPFLPLDPFELELPGPDQEPLTYLLPEHVEEDLFKALLARHELREQARELEQKVQEYEAQYGESPFDDDPPRSP